ncbi:unnamed protein product [Thlaspi arvense]|uniref:Uncharacterized protein n=1 Tax=Thlaspi arvense TaxID=13288 RepID=A0AAU9S4D0_THLAR|nr:unnamed protein product [Thlaspi arvense]
MALISISSTDPGSFNNSVTEQQLMKVQRGINNRKLKYWKEGSRCMEQVFKCYGAWGLDIEMK